MQSIGCSMLDAPQSLASQVFPLRLHLVRGDERPQIEIVHNDGHSWLV
jgi:hypothetical protein